MMSSLNNFSNHINDNLLSLSTRIVEEVVDRLEINLQPGEKEQAIDMYVQFLSYLTEVLDQDSEHSIPTALIEWSRKNAEMVVAISGKLSLIVVRYPPTRDVFTDIFTDLSEEFGLSIRQNAFIIKRINNLLDASLSETFSAYERLSEKKQEGVQKELVKLSAPVVPITEEIVVLPLIGYVDDMRVKHILENVIPEIAEKNIHHVITDFSGVATINEHVAHALHQIGGTLRLMGIHVVAAGLRPDLAQTIVNSSIDMSGIDSYATVKQALQSIR